MKKFLLSVLVLAVALFAAEKVYLAPVGLTGMHGDYAVALIDHCHGKISN